MTSHYFSYVQVDNKVAALERPQFFILPFWIKKTIERNQYNLVELLNKSTWLERFPKADLIDLLYINDFHSAQKNNSILRNLSDLNSSFISSLVNKYNPEIMGLFNHVDTNRERIEYAFRSAFESTKKEGAVDYYELSIVDNSIVIILLPNFFLMDEANVETFVREFIQQLYTLLPVSDVSTYSVFKTYLKSLGKKED